mmetsp:Transcript_27966/g.80821  ORF Transcript_27966/g.80821 Transcript_27966/m.80821 type:complete len:107 (-) Transcript_27966:894-1214(-)
MEVIRFRWPPKPSAPLGPRVQRGGQRDGASHEGGGPRADGVAEGGTSEFRGEEELDDAGGLSLISSTARAAVANDISGAYDAGPNAACPVEPFNLRAEREGGRRVL